MLIEMVIILAILSVVLAMGIYFNMDSFRSYSYHSDRDLLISLLQRARSQAQHSTCHALACEEAQSYGVYVESDTFTMFEGDTFSASTAEYRQVFEANPRTEYAGMNEVVFLKNSGNVLDTGDIILTDSAHRTSTIHIGKEGQISWKN